MSLLLFAAVCTALIGCAEFDQPLSARTESAADPALNGAWHVGDTSTLYIASENPHEHQIVVVSTPLAGGLEVATFTGYPTVVGNERFISIAFQGRALPSAWAHFRYHALPDEIELSVLDHNYLKEMVRRGVLPGKLRKVSCDSPIAPREKVKNLKQAGQAMGMLALRSLLNTMCHDITEVPAIKAKLPQLIAFYQEPETAGHFVMLEKPQRILRWKKGA